VQHSAGSIDDAAAAALKKDLAVGFGLLLLLAGSIAAIIISALRAKGFAQRQIDFVSSVSHEFRTPLAVIYSAGENLADGVTRDDGQISRYGELIKSEGKKLSSMVEQILDFAGARSGRRHYRFCQTSVAEVLGDAVQQCRPLIDDKNFELDVDVPEKLPAITADPSALSQAIQNLIANAIKYSNGSSWVRISAANGSGSIKIAVEDRGIGISRTDLKQVFDPFYRSKAAVDAQIHGNGFGLSLVRQIVEAHKGKVTVETEIGRGSRFTIELPVMSDAPA
jgi:signal transduction histidine kinase